MGSLGQVASVQTLRLAASGQVAHLGEATRPRRLPDPLVVRPRIEWQLRGARATPPCEGVAQVRLRGQAGRGDWRLRQSFARPSSPRECQRSTVRFAVCALHALCVCVCVCVIMCVHVCACVVSPLHHAHALVWCSFVAQVSRGPMGMLPASAILPGRFL